MWIIFVSFGRCNALFGFWYLQLRKAGFPDRLCNYCQFQLNTFHAFLKKAEASNNTFEEILGSAQDDMYEEGSPDQYDKDQYIEMQEMDENSENELQYMIDESLKTPKNEVMDEQSQIEDSITIEDDSNTVGTLEQSERDTINDDNESKPINYCGQWAESDKVHSNFVGDYLVEYLELDESSAGIEDDADIDVDASKDEDDPENDDASNIDGTTATTTSTSPRVNVKRTTGSSSKRSYPFRCKKCARRFMYKEVYDAHMRVHKGLPAFA